MPNINSELKELYEECVSNCADSLYRVAFRLLGNPTLANELVQETYLNAWKSLESLSDRSKLRSWMFAILRNQYTKLLRKESRAGRSSELGEVASSDATTEQADDGEAVQLALNQLEENQRLPILLVTMEGVSVEEASKILELPRGTVLSRIHRGKAKLKEILTRMGFETVRNENA